MKIAMVACEYPPTWGGIASVAYYLSEHYARLGHTVEVLARKVPGKLPPHHHRVRVHHLPWLKVPMAYTLSFGDHASRYLADLDVDVAQLQCPIVAMNDSMFSRIPMPTVATMEGCWRGERKGLLNGIHSRESSLVTNPNDLAILLTAYFFERYEKIAMERSTRVATISYHNRTKLREFSDPDIDIPVYYLGVDLEAISRRPEAKRAEIRARYGMKPDDPLVLFVGRMAARKGILSAARVLGRVLPRYPRAQAVLVGRGQLAARVRQLANKLGIGDRVHLVASLSFADIADHYGSADVFLFPTYYEGLGLAPMEGAAGGCAVVTTNYGPLPEIMDPDFAFMSRPGDIESMAADLDRLLADQDLREEMGQRAETVAHQRFRWEDCARAYEQLFESVLS